MEDPKNHNRFTNGMVSEGQLDLTLEEAKKLVRDLEDSIKVYEELDKLAKEHNRQLI